MRPACLSGRAGLATVFCLNGFLGFLAEGGSMSVLLGAAGEDCSEDAACPTSANPKDSQPCSGHGQCANGRCFCNFCGYRKNTRNVDLASVVGVSTSQADRCFMCGCDADYVQVHLGRRLAARPRRLSRAAPSPVSLLPRW